MGPLILDLYKKFEQKHSLFFLKKYLNSKDLIKDYFLENYSIRYSPIEDELYFFFECPRIPLKFIEYSDLKEGDIAYLSDKGKVIPAIMSKSSEAELLDKDYIPFLSVYFSNNSKMLRKKIISLHKQFSKLQKNISEYIVDKNVNLYIQLSLNQKSQSYYLGNKNWDIKVKKINKLVNHFDKTGKYPSFVNLSDHKKIVVKFSDSI